MSNEKKELTVEISKKTCYFPARFMLTFLLFWAMCLEYAQRVCLSVTIVVMVNHTALDPPNTTSEEDLSCPSPLLMNETDPKHQGEYVWAPSTQGIILGAYYYGFICTQVVGGRLAEVAGGKWPLGLAILIGSLLTLITPIAADIGVVAIVIVRVTIGLLHGICLPTAFAMFAHWSPIEERSTLLSLCFIGDQVGTILSMPLAGYLCDNGFDGGWPSVFYILGMLGCVWFVFWACLAYNKPSDHPRISMGELDYIRKGNIQIEEQHKPPVPWKEVLGSLPVWSTAIVMFCAAWGHTTLLTKLPTYLEIVLHIPIQKNALLNSMIYVCTCVTLFISAYLSDYLRSNRGYSPTKVRKVFQMFAMLGPAVCTAFIPLLGCRKDFVIILLALAMTFLGLSGGGCAAITADMAPRYAGTIFGFVNGLGCTAGVLSPLVAGLILDNAHASINQWSSVFYVSAGLYAFGGTVFFLFASSEKQSWAYNPIKEQYLIYPNMKKEQLYESIREDLEKSLKYGSF